MNKINHTIILSIIRRGLRNSLFILCTLFMLCSHAETDNVLMWQMPSSGINFPVYVFKDNKQSAYLYSSSQQSILGKYHSTTTATYDLYYQSGNTKWNSCKLILKSGSISPHTTCPGAVINPPVTTSNVYTVAFGSTAWPASVAPVYMPSYGSRSITFKNDTAYDKIRIGQVCTKSKNPNNSKCKNNQNRWEVAKGDTRVFQYDATYKGGLTGLISTAFTVTAYKKAGTWVETGGYGAGQTPYATKVEMTALPVDNKTENGTAFLVPQGNTNFDISVVDGYNISAKAYPIGGSYCTYTVPPENSNVLGVGYYDSSTVLASIEDSEALCTSSSQLPVNYAGPDTPWDLAQTDSADNYKGCLSPCTYTKVNGKSSQNKFCCTGSYGTPTSCNQAKGVIGANTSTYVKNLDSNHATHVYRFAYDDAIGDFACPPQTSIAVIFE
ncbi:thaumatin family protein [Shewanella surugensis]|uniref:Thaumatin family protein n=1 Tax=Shewanella surugensis TaxID=212020 RepID=A0ABT0LFT3_9GAMM|nr:thaumatin family protein [Shewanella surugensis]MCL1126330.1 thaumatin family protein [Shewanella surugensis]